MRTILWVELPYQSEKGRAETDEFFRKEFADEPDLRILVTYGDAKLHLFGKPLFKYPYWLLKVKLWLRGLFSAKI